MSGGETGYVQFLCRWEQDAPPAGPEVERLIEWRDRLFRMGMIGAGPDGVGFGNLSCRTESGGSFIVSGTATGALGRVGPEHFTRVTGHDLRGNSLSCRGSARASSESLSHAAVYRAAAGTGAVVHVHHGGMWKWLRGRVPTTDDAATAGTPGMADEILRLLREPGARSEGLLVMGGHRDGLLAFGASVDGAGERLLRAVAEFVSGSGGSGRY